MYKYKNSLRHFDENKYPYSVEFIKESVYDNYHGACNEKGFNIQSAGAKHLFCTPELKDISIKFKVEFSRYKAPFRQLAFSILCGYNKALKSGYAISFRYDYNMKCFYVSLEEIVCSKKTIVSETKFENYDIKCDFKIPIEIVVSEESIVGSYGKLLFSFDHKATKGRTGIDVSDLSEYIIFSDVEIFSKEKVKKSLVCSQTYTLPRLNGGELPYRMKIDVLSYDSSIYEVRYKLDGGTGSREERETYNNTWLPLCDDITNMYIRIYEGDSNKKYYLFIGSVRFFEQNLRDVFKASQPYLYNVKYVPLEGSFYINKYSIDMLLGIGYEEFSSTAYKTMTGSSEYIFNSSGKLLYGGKPLDYEPVLILESKDKKILSEIPETIWNYEDALNHAEKNHYFYTDEIPHFQYRLYRNNSFKFTGIKISLLDAYFTKLKDVQINDIRMEAFEIPDYKMEVIPFEIEELPCGVYHISAELLYGDVVICQDWSAFEVIDKRSSVSPQEASGLPSIHLGDGGINLSLTGVPDFYAETPSHDWGHYCNTALIGPIPAQEMRIWELLKFYKRDLFIWPTVRTIKGYDIEKLGAVMANADYINPSVPGLEDVPRHAYRYDYYDYNAYGSTLKEALNEFLDINPEYRNKLGIQDALESFRIEDHVKLLKTCGSEWIDFAVERVVEKFKKQSAEIRKNNPGFKRSSYGPLSAYYAPYLGGYSVKWYGIPIEKMNEIYDGFLQLEDYPYSAAYHTTRGAWLIMTAKLLDARVKIYPELYFDWVKGCPDAATECAYPPHSYSECPFYFTMTQICEYVYGTAYFNNGKFDYWRDSGFSPQALINNCKDRAKEIFTFWGKALKNKPMRPAQSPLFLYEINVSEDRYDYHIKRNHFYNISESNLAYTYDLMRTSGMLGGFVSNYRGLSVLTERDINCIVLPNLTYATNDTLQKIRELHKKGVLLIAISKVPGLEDLFGVCEKAQTIDVNFLTDGDSSEDIMPNQAEFFYENNGGQIVLETNEKVPVVITNNNTILLNTAIEQVGIDAHVNIEYQGRPNISKLLADTLRKAISSQLCQEIESDIGTGVILADTENSEKILLLTDYSKYSQEDREKPTRKEIRFYRNDVVDVEYIGVCNDNIQLGKNYQSGVLKGISVMLRSHETLMFKLILKSKQFDDGTL